MDGGELRRVYEKAIELGLQKIYVLFWAKHNDAVYIKKSGTVFFNKRTAFER